MSDEDEINVAYQVAYCTRSNSIAVCTLKSTGKRGIRLNFYVFEIDSAGHSHSDKDTSLTIIYIVSKDETVDPKKK